MKWLFFIVLLILPTSVLAGSISIHPLSIPNGGVALLKYQGDPGSEVSASFNGKSVPLSHTGRKFEALLGSDIDMKPGRYPIEISVRHGKEKSSHRTFLRVYKVKRPEERLSLPKAMVSPVDPKVLKRIIAERKMLTALFARKDTPPLWRNFALPVPDPKGSVFGLRRILNGKPKSPHAGLDFRSPRGRQVKAPARGRVAFSGDLYYTGKTVVLDHGQGLYSIYAHLQSLSADTGAILEPGQVLGKVGSTGRSTGPHLHWGIKLRGDRIDPELLLALTQS